MVSFLYLFEFKNRKKIGKLYPLVGFSMEKHFTSCRKMFPIQKGTRVYHNIGTKATYTKCTFDIQAKNFVCSCLQIVMGK